MLIQMYSAILYLLETLLLPLCLEFWASNVGLYRDNVYRHKVAVKNIKIIVKIENKGRSDKVAILNFKNTRAKPFH